MILHSKFIDTYISEKISSQLTNAVQNRTRGKSARRARQRSKHRRSPWVRRRRETSPGKCRSIIPRETPAPKVNLPLVLFRTVIRFPKSYILRKEQKFMLIFADLMVLDMSLLNLLAGGLCFVRHSHSQPCDLGLQIKLYMIKPGAQLRYGHGLPSFHTNVPDMFMSLSPIHIRTVEG